MAFHIAVDFSDRFEMNDSLPLQRFIDAQATTFDKAISELRAGRKQTHWMWFVFPQIRGLGRSETARYFAIASRDEARAYLAHPLLGARLRECTEIVQGTQGRSIGEIFGAPDDLKFHSSMTLFANADAPGSVFQQTLDKCFEGRGDVLTLEILGRSP
jgi:uncharacterized protein (DUF1810 family)